MDDLAALTRNVLALRPAWLAADLADFEFLPGGYSNQNYQFRHRGQGWDCPRLVYRPHIPRHNTTP